MGIKTSMLPLKEQLLAKQIAVELAAVLGPMLQQQIEHMNRVSNDHVTRYSDVTDEAGSPT